MTATAAFGIFARLNWSIICSSASWLIVVFANVAIGDAHGILPEPKR